VLDRGGESRILDWVWHAGLGEASRQLPTDPRRSTGADRLAPGSGPGGCARKHWGFGPLYHSVVPLEPLNAHFYLGWLRVRRNVVARSTILRSRVRSARMHRRAAVLPSTAPCRWRLCVGTRAVRLSRARVGGGRRVRRPRARCGGALSQASPQAIAAAVQKVQDTNAERTLGNIKGAVSGVSAALTTLNGTMASVDSDVKTLDLPLSARNSTALNSIQQNLFYICLENEGSPFRPCSAPVEEP
jgi:hypothetical protein